MQLITRAQWGARPRGDGSVTPFTPRGVAVHYEGEGWAWPWAHSTCDDKVRQIQAYHMDGRGWSDIAYNFLACPHGYVFEGRGLNRRSSANGTWDANTWWYAVQCMWGTRSGSVPELLLSAARDAIDYCRAKGGAGQELRGHRDLHSTDCPGDQLYAWTHRGAPRPAITTPGDVKPPPSTKDIIDMATQAEVAEAVSDGIRAYMRDFFKDEQGTGDTILDDTRAHNQRVEEKLDRLVTAVEGLVAVLGRPNA